jgi:hypothetical protein
MALITAGTPFVGSVALSNAAPGPANFSLVVDQGSGVAYTLAAAGAGAPSAERVFVTNVLISSSDTATAQITLDSGSVGSGGDATPTVWLVAQVSISQPLQPVMIPRGVLRGVPGVVPRLTASAVTAGKTVTAIIIGYIAR